MNRTRRLLPHLAVLGATFLLCGAILFFNKPLDPASFAYKGADNHYFYTLAERFKPVWQEPFHYIPRLVFGGLSERELVALGFNKESDFDSFSRSPTYIAWLSLWLVLFGSSTPSLVLSQAFLLALMSWGVFLVLRRFLQGPWPYLGVLFNLLYLSYFPSAAQTMSENIQIALVPFVLLFFDRAVSDPASVRRRHLLGLAVTLTLLIFSKNAFRYLTLLAPATALWVFLASPAEVRRRPLPRNPTLLLLVFFSLSYLPANAVVSRSVAEGSDSQIGAWRNFYAGSMTATDGYNLNTGYHGLEFRRNIGRGTAAFWFNRYSQVCRHAVLDIAKSRPFDFFALTVRKFGLLNLYPGCNQESISLLRGLRGLWQVRFHIFGLLLALLAFLIPDRRLVPLKALLLILTLYVTGLFSLSNTDTRYALPLAVPRNILVWLLLARLATDAEFRRGLLPFLLMTAASAALVFTSFHPSLGRILPSLRGLLLLRSLVFLAAFLPAALLLARHIKSFHRAELLLPLTVLAAVLVTGQVRVWTDPYANRIPLPAGRPLSLTIVPDPWPPVPAPRRLFLAVDASFASPEESLDILMNGMTLRKVRPTEARTTPHPNVENPPFRPRNAFWVFVELDSSLLRRTNTVEIRPSRGAALAVAKPDDPRRPSFLHYSVNLEEIVYDPGSAAERRLFLPLRPSSRRLATSSDDPLVYLVSDTGGRFFVRQDAVALQDANIKLIALYNPVDAGLVVWRDDGVAPPGFLPAQGNLGRYLLGELDRLRTGLAAY